MVTALTDLLDFRPGALPPALLVPRLPRGFDAAIRPPGSKSLTNRALLLAALARGRSTLRAPLIEADDAQVMLAALRALGATIEHAPAETLHITGVAGRWSLAGPDPVTLNLHNAGTATRFLAAAALLTPPGSPGLVIDGDARMRERPIGELTAALARLGAGVRHRAAADCPPVLITPPPHPPADTPTIEFGRTASSQFLSALLLIAPGLPRGLRLAVRGELTSPDYVWMTLALLERVGVPVHRHPTPGLSLDVTIPPHTLAAFDLTIEPDASGATYFQAAAALFPRARVTLLGLPADPALSLQGDARFTAPLAAMGASVTGERGGQAVTGPLALAPVEVDLSRMPDTAQTLAALACFAAPTANNPNATSTLHGLRTLRVKETDRLAALHTELSRVGATVEIFACDGDESLRITPPPDFDTPPRDPLAPARGDPVTFNTYHDHRMAMSLALIGLRAPRPIVINDPACVRKTYPTFWRDLRALYPPSPPSAFPPRRPTR